MEKKPIKLIVGLGNPGNEYAYTRHNAGEWFVTQVAEYYNESFSADKKFHAKVARANYNTLWLEIPQTFMNKSGIAVAALANFYKIEPDEILVAHDELDLPVGSVRFKFGGGHNGHNGLKDIDKFLGTRDYWRMRIGIDHPGSKAQVVNYVLSRPPLEEFDEVVDGLKRVITQLPKIVAGDWEAVMLAIHSSGKKPERAANDEKINKQDGKKLEKSGLKTNEKPVETRQDDSNANPTQSPVN